MRLIGTISSPEHTQRFADHLRANGIGCSTDEHQDGFRVWVHEDDRVDVAKAELMKFLVDPGHARYRESEKQAVLQFQQEANRIKAARKNIVRVSDPWNRTRVSVPWNRPRPVSVVTMLLIGVSVLVGIRTGLEPQRNDELVRRMYFSIDTSFRPIMSGEVWRLVTPIFLHYGPQHLLFNMLMLYQFGLAIESRVRTVRFLLMVIVIAALSNFAQFLFHGPLFGGMSGVVYGLFGYHWIKGRMVPESGLELPQQTVTIMLVWHVLCMLGIIPNIANWAHGMGLVAGMAIAFFDSIIYLKGFR